MKKIRCDWCIKNEKMMEYHDNEWGVPIHDDKKHFEFITLDAFQAGLSWQTIINKRENFRKAFDNFDFERIAEYSSEKIDLLLQDTGIIRNKVKILATVNNAKAFKGIREKYGSFNQYIWQFTNFKTIVNKRVEIKDIPASSQESDAMSKSLIENGFKFVGTTICYAYMQAAGMVNDHLISCFRYK